jgi:hypothetical protein
VGKATANFTDLLTWAGVSEDEFNAKLAEANNSTERANIVLEELARQGLTEAGEAWRENNKDIVAVNEAQAEFDEALGRLGELLSPLAADLINFGADAIGALVDWLKSAVENTKAAYEWLRKFFDFEARESRRHELLPGPVDGSHASGLRYVPFDGYTAELHKGEMVLTAAQADRIRGVSSSGSDYRGMMSGLVNAVNTMQTGTAIPEEITLTLKSDNGQTMGRWLVPFVRSENKSNPEVVSDPL